MGKFILGFLLVAGAVIPTAVDWNTTHLFNPAWHPHARFHDALFLLILDGTTLIVLWLAMIPVGVVSVQFRPADRNRTVPIPLPALRRLWATAFRSLAGSPATLKCDLSKT